MPECIFNKIDYRLSEQFAVTQNRKVWLDRRGQAPSRILGKRSQSFAEIADKLAEIDLGKGSFEAAFLHFGNS